MSLNSDNGNDNTGTQLSASAAAKVAELLATERVFAAFDFSRRAEAGAGDGVLEQLTEMSNLLQVRSDRNEACWALRRAQRENSGVAFVMIDIEHFKF